MKAIPKKIKIGPITYKVIEIDDMNKVMESQTAVGSVDFVKSEIRLYSGLSHDKKWAVLMHEIIHAIDENFSLDFNEATTDRVAVGVIDVLLTNRLGLQ